MADTGPQHVLELHEKHGMTHREISAHLGMPQPTVTRRIREGRKERWERRLVITQIMLMAVIAVCAVAATVAWLKMAWG